MRKKILTSVCLIAVAFFSNAQQATILKPQVTSASGGSGTAGNFYMSYTIGQPVSFKGQAQNTLLTQGFQQPLGCMPYQDEEICFVTVDTNSLKNQVLWRKTYNKGTDGYIIYKEVSANDYDSIGYVPFALPGVFTDINSNPEINSNRYKIVVKDTCDNKSELSPYHQTMLLQISQGGIPSTMVLYWTFYVDESGAYVPSKYYIYRGTSPSTMVLHDSISGSQNSYNDLNVFDVYYYRLAIHKNSGCDSISSQANSYSNIKDNLTVGISENSIGTITISPNPMTSTATLTIPNFGNQLSANSNQLTVTDITGKIVRSEPITIHGLSPDKPSPAQITIERGNLKPGIYFVEVNANRIYKGKLVVE